MPRLRLQDRILAIILGVVLPFATLTFVAVDRKVANEAQVKLSAELGAARESFDEVRRLRLENLGWSARLVSELPYFKAAVAVYDPLAGPALHEEQVNTILPIAGDVMENVDLDFIALSDRDHAIVTGICGDEVLDPRHLGTGFDRLVRKAAAEGMANGCLAVDGALYEIVVVPMSAGGLPLGMLALGRRFDDRLAAGIRKITAGDVFILAGHTPIARSIDRAGLDQAMAAYLDLAAYHLPGPDSPVPLELASERYLTLWTPIDDPDGKTIGSTVMLMSLDRALAYAQAIRGLMVVIWIAALVAALGLSVAMARGITRPIQGLVAASARIAEGDFSQEVPVSGGDELETLGESFNRMNIGLRVSHEQLALYNRRLEERTEELEQSHARLLRNKQALEETNRELRETQAQLIQAGKMAAFGELGAGLAHELNQPLASVKGFAQLTLGRLESESPHRRNIDLIVQSVDHMARIVKGLRDFARQSSFESAPVDVNQVIEQTALFLSTQLKRNRIRLDLELANSLPIVSGDANQLQQVFTNLVTNARDALEGRPEPSIRIRTRSMGGGRFVAVTVTDNGAGIPDDVRRNIFRSFYTTKEPGKGTGLGLSISRGIAENHGGRLNVLSTTTAGTTFTLVLPSAVNSGKLPDQGNRGARAA